MDAAGDDYAPYAKAALLLCLLVPIVHSAVFTHPFILDERPFVAENEELRDWRNIPFAFIQGWQGERLYRPLLQVSLTLDWLLWRQWPFGYRLTSCLWHILAALLAFAMFRKMGFADDVCYMTTCIYALHPIHTEVLNCVSFRGDTMCACFCLMTWLFYDKKQFWSWGCFAFACLSKETGVAMAVVLLLRELLLAPGEAFSEKCRRLFPYIAIAFLYLVLRTYAIGGIADSRDAFVGVSFAAKMRTMSLVFVVYLRLCAFPIYLGFDYQLNDFAVLSSFGDSRSWLGLIAVLSYAAIFFACVRKHRYIAFWMGWFVAFLLPVSNVIPTAVVAGERFLTLPVLAFALLLGTGIGCIARQRRMAYFLIIVNCLAMLAFYRNGFWQQPREFYRRMLRLSPNSYIAHMRLGQIHYRKGEFDTALGYLRRAVELRCYPKNSPMAPINCGYICARLGDVQGAVHYFEMAVSRIEKWSLEDEYPQVFHNLEKYLQQARRQQNRLYPGK